MSFSFGHAGCWKMMVKSEIFYAKIGQNLNFLVTWEFTPVLKIEITLDGVPKLKWLIFTIFDQNQCNEGENIEKSMVVFFVNPPERAEHGLKCIKSKI